MDIGNVSPNLTASCSDMDDTDAALTPQVEIHQVQGVFRMAYRQILMSNQL